MTFKPRYLQTTYIHVNPLTIDGGLNAHVTRNVHWSKFQNEFFYACTCNAKLVLDWPIFEEDEDSMYTHEVENSLSMDLYYEWDKWITRMRKKYTLSVLPSGYSYEHMGSYTYYIHTSDFETLAKEFKAQYKKMCKFNGEDDICTMLHKHVRLVDKGAWLEQQASHIEHARDTHKRDVKIEQW